MHNFIRKTLFTIIGLAIIFGSFLFVVYVVHLDHTKPYDIEFTDGRHMRVYRCYESNGFVKFFDVTNKHYIVPANEVKLIKELNRTDGEKTHN